MEVFGESCADHMSTPVYSVHADASLEDVRDRLLDYKITSMAVIEPASNEFLGVITRSDLFRCGALRLSDGRAELIIPNDTVSSVMTQGAICVRADQAIADAAMVMRTHRIHRVFVLTEAGAEGVISCRDVMRMVGESDLDVPLHEIMTSPVLTVRADEMVGDAMERIIEYNITQLVVLDGGWPCGFISQDEILAGRRVDVETPVKDMLNSSLLVEDMRSSVHACAASAVREEARQIVATHDARIVGVASALDFCKLAAAA